jgi:REP element-mobilizing transposase RayT
MPAQEPADASSQHPGHLPRLADGAYRGAAIVHWTLTVRDRGVGWLDAPFTTRFRWLLLHACARYAVACPVHCLMPDHVHLLLHGWSQEGDQKGFILFLRKHSNDLLKETNHRWQPQAHDHVLRPQESGQNEYEGLVHYITQNPVRAGFVKRAEDWPHTGSVIPGYPELKLWLPDFWERYWRLRKSRGAL